MNFQVARGDACFSVWLQNFKVLQIGGRQGRKSGACDDNPIWESGNLAARGSFFGANGDEWRCMTGFWVTGFLGFGRGRSWSTFVVLVSLGEAWICADLIS